MKHNPNNKDSSKSLLLYQKISLVLFGLLLTIIFLEITLRIGGFTILSLQEHRNLESIRQKGSFRIMCLGESTTQNQYPSYLETILNQHDIGIKFSVLDKGIVSTNTAIILSQLEANLDKYQPDMVVTMMGVNDSGAHMPYDAPSDSKLMLALRSLKVYKLTRLLWLHMTTILKEKGFYLQDIHKQKYSSMEAYKELQEEQSFKKAIEINPDNEAAYDGLGKLYRNRGKFTEAEESFKKAIEFNPDHASLCGDLAAIYYEMSNNKLYEIYAKKADSFRDKYYNINTANNYYKLKHILDKRNIKLVCAQYPICNIKPLKRVFEEEAGGIIFVDNEKIFKDAVRKTSYKEYFIDMFGGDFGHCTDKGNDLLARNIADAILKEVFGN